MSLPPNNNTSEVNRATQFFDKGNFTEALKIVETLEQQKDLSIHNYIQNLILKSSILTNLARYEEAFKLAESALEESQQLQDHLHILDALIAKAAAQRRLGNVKGSLHTIEQAEQQLLSLSQEQSSEHPLRKAKILFWKGSSYWSEGKFDCALEFLEQSLTLSKQIGNQLVMAETLHNIGICYFHKNALDEFLEYTQKSFRLFEEIGHKVFISRSLLSFGVLSFQKGEFNQALDYFQRSLTLREEIGEKLGISHVLDLIARVYHMNGDLEQALEYGKQSLALCEPYNYDYQTASALFHLIPIVIDMNLLDQAQMYVQRLQQLNAHEDNKFIDQICRLSEAMVLKTSTRARHRVKAEELLEQLSKEEIVFFEVSLLTLLHLCDLLLVEFRTSGNSEVLRDLKSHVTHLMELAKQHHSHWVLAETYVLQARLALLDLDLSLARQLFQLAQLIAEEQGMQWLAIQISNEHDALLNQLDQWQDFIDQNVTMVERIELANLEEQVVQMIRKRVEELPELPEEDPELLLIIGLESGLNMYSKPFHPDRPLEEHLIAGFLTAINAFGRDAFAAGSIERIKYEESMVLLQPIDPILICYVFQGPSYYALQKLTKFSETLKAYPPVWQTLTEALKIKRIITEDEQIDALVSEIFLPSVE